MARPYQEVGGDDVLVGSVVADRYHVAGILGQGTTGTVFGVEHVQFGRRMAMKVLRPRSTQTDVVHRVFNGDARAAWSVNHPCLVDVSDVGTLPDGAPFFVTEYLQGETLAKRMGRDRVSLAASVDVMMQVLAAISAVHERALLVRDLRPQNIFLVHRRGCRPIAKILDLGLGRLTPLEAVAEQWEADPRGAAVAFPHPFYLSPERTRSEHGIDFASDLFVAGVIFYEMLTGSRPFAAPSYNGLLLQIAQASPPPVSELRDHSLAELDEFVERALSGNPRSRFASAKEMQDELRRIFENNKRSASASTAMQTSGAVPPSGSGPSIAPPGPSMSTDRPPMSPGFPPPPQKAPSFKSPMAATMGPATGAAHSHPGAASSIGAVSSVKPIASVLEPPTPRDKTVATDPPVAVRSSRIPVLSDEADLFADETETDRKFFDLAPFRTPSSTPRMPSSQAISSVPRFDEASADNPHKTVRPEAEQPGQPPTVQAFQPMPLAGLSDDDFDEATESRNALADPVLRSIREANKTPIPPPSAQDEETQQLEMTPELRAKIEAQYAARAARDQHRPPAQSDMDSIPPPTKRLDK